MCTGTRCFSPQTHTFSGLPRIAKSCPRKLGATALRATCGVLDGELRAEGRSAPSPGLMRGGVGSSSRLRYKRLSRSRRTTYIARDPQFPPFPTQNGPTGFPRRPRRAAVVISRRQTPASTSRDTNRRAVREGLAARFGLPSPFPLCTTDDSRTPQSNSKPASRFTGRMPWGHYGGPFLCFAKSLHRFAELTRDDLK
jgi:hypothetical protein